MYSTFFLYREFLLYSLDLMYSLKDREMSRVTTSTCWKQVWKAHYILMLLTALQGVHSNVNHLKSVCVELSPGS